MAVRQVSCFAIKNVLNCYFSPSTSMILEKCTPLLCTEILHIRKHPFRSEQVRFYAARKGKRQALQAAKKAQKLNRKEETKEKIRPYMRRSKDAVEMKARRCTDDNWPQLLPIDDVWRMDLYKGKPYSVSEAVSMHQETHHPTILNEPDAYLLATIELDMSLKKKNKFLDGFSGLLLFPHEFEAETLYSIIALCKTQEDQEKAIEAGAVWAGSVNIVKRLLSGEIKKEDYDYVVCHPDAVKDLISLRGILKRNFPSLNNGSISLDISKAVHQFRSGIKYYAVHDKYEPDFGSFDICIGKLNMQHEQLENNLKFLLAHIEENHKPKGTEKRPFITRVSLHCSKSEEKFKVPHWEYLPGYMLSSTGTVQMEVVEEKGGDEDEEEEGDKEKRSEEVDAVQQK